MRDFLLDLSRRPQARKLVQGLGLPIPMPQPLERGKGPWNQQPLKDLRIAVRLDAPGRLAATVAQTLARAGADPWVTGPLAPFAPPGEAYGRPARRLEVAEIDSSDTWAGIVFDATDLDGPRQLRRLYDGLHPLLGGLAPCGRVVVLGRPPAASTSSARAAAQAALSGFVRSLGRELGRRGSTAQLVLIADGAEARLEGPLRFLLSARSAYVSGQVLGIDTTARAPTDELQWVVPLENKVALVTGAARGIGRATVERLAAEGARVVCLDRPQDDGPTSQLARRVGGRVLLADVSAPDSPQRIARFLDEEMGGVDVVVHNAGVTRDRTLRKMSPNQWDQALDINLGAVVDITAALVEGPLNDEGRIICLSSVSGIAGNLGQTNYSASKAGLIGLVTALAGPLGQRGVTVNAVAPGFIETRLTRAMPAVLREVARRMNSLGQGGQPGDVAEVITFLSSPGAVGLTGQVLRVCGGALVGA